MRSFSVLLALLFALVATSFAAPEADFADIEFSELEARQNRNRTGGDPTRRACKEMRKLTRITKLASNQTRLDKLVADGKLTTAKVEQLKQKAAEAGPKLQAMSTNTTLTTTCATIAAEGKMKSACKQMKRLQRMSDLVKNQTALDAFAVRNGLNSTRVDRLKAKVQRDQTKLTELSSNTTLTTFCSQQKSANGNAGGNAGNAGGGAAGNAAGSASGSTSGNTQAGASNPNNAAASGRPQQATSNAASGTHMTPATLPYVVVSMIAGAFVLLL